MPKFGLCLILAALLTLGAWTVAEEDGVLSILPPLSPSLPEQSRAALLDCADATEQIVLVEYAGRSDAIVSLHEKKDGVWTQLDECAGYVGRNGMGKAVAGDKKTPLGTYNLTTPFGILDDPGSAMPYTKLTKYHYWCGSSSSGYYNQFVDSRVTGRPVSSSDEYLISYKGFYNYCLFIDYNAEGVPGLGSCIFLHCIGTRDYTAGCVAVPEDFMRRILCWARYGTRIVLLSAPLDPDEALTPSGEGVILCLGDSVNVRSGPGLDYAVVGSMSRGQRGRYLGQSRADERGMLWHRVRANGLEGWISSRYASLSDD